MVLAKQTLALQVATKDCSWGNCCGQVNAYSVQYYIVQYQRFICMKAIIGLFKYLRISVFYQKVLHNRHENR